MNHGPGHQPADLFGFVRGQAPFLCLTLAIGVLRFVVPPGRVPGAAETWATVLGLWLLGLTWAAIASARDERPTGDLVGAIGVQNAAIQLTISVPSILVGVGRMAGAAESSSGAFPSNALTTLVVLPLGTLLVLTTAALLPAFGLRAMARTISAKMRRGIYGTALALLLASTACVGAEPDVARDSTGVPLEPGDIAAGKALYERNGCAVCHGEDGSGRGPNAAFMNPPPRDYRNPSAYKQGISVAEIAGSIAAGFIVPGGGMPAFGHLSETERRQLGSFVASMQRPEAEHLEIVDSWIAEPPPGARTTALYLSVANTGERDDTLTGIEVRGARSAEIHTIRSADGTMQMQPLEALPIPAGATVALEPGATHIMLSVLIARPAAGESVDVTLFFNSRSAKRFAAPVRRRQ